MKVINSEVQVSFVAATINDAIIMLPVMNNILRDFESFVEYLRNAKRISSAKNYVADAKEKQRQLKILRQCGFVATDEDVMNKALSIDIDAEANKLQFDENGNRI